MSVRGEQASGNQPGVPEHVNIMHSVVTEPASGLEESVLAGWGGVVYSTQQLRI